MSDVHGTSQSLCAFRYCMCEAVDSDTGEKGWRPCPPSLCERTDHHLMPPMTSQCHCDAKEPSA